jgi:hypothetical protein
MPGITAFHCKADAAPEPRNPGAGGWHRPPGVIATRPRRATKSFIATCRRVFAGSCISEEILSTTHASPCWPFRRADLANRLQSALRASLCIGVAACVWECAELSTVPRKNGLTAAPHCVSAPAAGTAATGSEESQGSADEDLPGASTGAGSVALSGAAFHSLPSTTLLRHASFAAIKPGLRARGISFQSERSLTSVDGVATGAVTGAIATGCSLGSARFAIRAVQPSSGVDPREARVPQASSIWAGCAAGLLHGSARETSAGSRSSAFAVAWSSPKAAHASAAFSRPEWTSRNSCRSGGRDMAIPLSMQNREA